MKSLLFSLAAASLLACSGAEAPPPAPDAVADDTTEPAPDAVEDTAGPDGLDTGAQEPPPWPPELVAVAERPAGSMLPDPLASCGVLHNERCTEGQRERCALYDTATGGFPAAADVPPMTLQAYTFERYYDRYHRMNGQASDVDFTGPMLAGTPESEWSSPEAFRRYDGIGDASGWTGTGLWAAAARYQVQGTEASYERMLDHLEDMMLLYEVTGIEGMLARSHFAMLPEGAPLPTGHWGKAISPFRVADGSDGHFVWPIPEALADRLPDYYDGSVEIGGETVPTVPRVMADASRDMYVRSLPGVMLAWDMLGQGAREEGLRTLIARQMSCTLNRLKRGRIVNLQQNPDILEAVTQWFSGPSMVLDPDDMEVADLDELVFFVMEQPRPGSEADFDADCPDGPPMDTDPELIFDAADPTFLLQLVTLADRENRGGKVPIAWSMHVTVRPSDLLFVMQWAMTAHYVTGDAQYLEFLADLLDDVPWQGVMKLWGAFALPKYCAPHFAPSIGYPSLYNVIARIDRERFADFHSFMAEVARTEGREKGDGQREDPFFGILYHGMTEASVDPTGAELVQASVAHLATYGMNPDDKLEPDRSYPRNFVDNPDPEVPLEEIAPGDPTWTLCEEPMTVFGIEVPPPKIDGIPVRSVDPLPLSKRIGGTMLWQMDPWMVKREYGGVGMETQWPMIGMFTPYWIGRMHGVIEEGRDLGLAWEATGEPCP